MNRKKISFELSVYESAEELSEEYRNLLELASGASKDAYAPYSEFRVGAALLLSNGEIVTGNNQENASSPSGLCAERVAIFHAGAKYPGLPIKAIAIFAASSKIKVSKPATPCGNCRQAIIEYEQRQQEPIEIIMAGETGAIYHCASMKDLLPMAFGNSDLKRD